MAAAHISDRTLAQLLSVLSKKELGSFRKYLQASNQHSQTVLLAVLDVLIHWISGRRKKPLRAREVQEKAGIAASTLEKSLSQILSLLRAYIREQALRENSLEDYGYVLDYWFHKSLDPKLYAGELRRYSQKLKELPESVGRAMLQLNLEDRAAQIRVQQPRERGKELFSGYVVQLEVFYVTARLKYTCAELNAWKVLGGEKPECNIEGLFDRLEMMQQPLPALGQAYLNSLDMLRDVRPVEEKIIAQFAFLEKHQQGFATEENSDLYGFLLNSAIRILNLGTLDTVKQVWSIYDAMLEHGLLLESGRIKGWHFGNYVMLKLISGCTEEARAFIEQYQDHLSPEETKSVLPLARGRLELYSRNFSTAIAIFRDLLNQPPEDVFWEIEARSLLWMAYYGGRAALDMEGHDAFLKFYDTFRVALARNEKIRASLKHAYTNFCRLFNRFVRITSGHQDAAQHLEALQREVVESKDMRHREWVLAEIRAQLEKLN